MLCHVTCLMPLYHDAACIVGFDTNWYLNERDKGKNGVFAAFSFATLLIGSA